MCQQLLDSHPRTPPQPRHHKRGRHRVFIVTPSADFRPTDPAEVPHLFDDVETLATALTLQTGIATIRHHNQKQLDADQVERWAVLVFCPHVHHGGADA